MSEMNMHMADDLARCEDRAKRLAKEKSYLQLVNNLMMRLSEASGLEHVLQSMLRLILDNIGGSNVSIYYYLGQELQFADVYGRTSALDKLDDELVRRVLETRTLCEVVHDFEHTRMMTPEFTKSSTWAVPLIARDELVGVLKLDDMLMAAAEIRTHLEPFIRYSALVLKNELSDYAALKKAYDELSDLNMQLSREILQRKDAESSLRITQFSVDRASDSLFWITPDARFANVNDSACRRLGYSREELLAMTVFDVDPAFPREAWDSHWQEIRERKAFTIETKHKTKRGDIYPVDVTLNYVEYEGAEYNFAFARDITERKRAEEALRESEKQVRRKLEAILSPEADISALELSDLIDSDTIQGLMDKFYALTGIGIGIIDLHGRVLVGTGWQDICTKFHRVNPESSRLCRESDLELSRNVPAGTFKLYRCKNNMWDLATPILLGDRHVGNIFLGQFLFTDETVDHEAFRRQAIRYGFDEREYLAALDKAPRWNRSTVEAVMSFYAAFADMIGNLSYANVKLASALEDRRRAEDEVRLLNAQLEQRVAERTAELATTLEHLRIELEERRQIEGRLRITQFSVDSSADAIFWIRADGSFSYANSAACAMFGYSTDEFMRLKTYDLNPAHRGAAWQQHWNELKQQGALRFETQLARKDGTTVPIEITANYIVFEDREYNCAFVRDISERMRAEEVIRRQRDFSDSLIETAQAIILVLDPEGRIIRYNSYLETLSGFPLEEMRGRNWMENFLPVHERDRIRALFANASAGVQTKGNVNAIRTRSGDERLIEWYDQTLKDEGGAIVGLLAVGLDVTDRKLTELKLSRETAANAQMTELSRTLLAAGSIDEIANETLRMARQFTKSQFGYVGYIDKATGRLICPTMTNDVWDQCGIPGKSVVFEKFGGLWGWVLNNRKSLMTNEPAADSRSSGAPPGHIPIKRFLSVPAFCGDILIGQIALANSAEPYCEEDLQLVERMATILGLAISRKHAEDELRSLNDRLDQVVKERTAELVSKIGEIERMNKIFVGREVRMVELKEKIRELEKKNADSAGQE